MAADGARGEGRRRRREGLAGAPAQQGRRPVKGRNRPRGGRRSSPHEESSHGSPQATNRGGDGAPGGGGNGAPAAQRAREEGEGRLICGPKSSDSPSTFSRLHPFFHGGCPGGEDDGGGGEGDERGVVAREHHRWPPGAPPPVARRSSACDAPCANWDERMERGDDDERGAAGALLSFRPPVFFFAVYFNQYQRCYIIGVDGGFV